MVLKKSAYIKVELYGIYAKLGNLHYYDLSFEFELVYHHGIILLYKKAKKQIPLVAGTYCCSVTGFDDFCRAMVRVSYQNIEEQYEQIKEAACGRQACSVMILVAHEVRH
jgi:hypothetical protein